MTLFAEVSEALTMATIAMPLHAALDVNPRRVRAWAAGEEPVPEGVWRELYEMLRQQAVENARLSHAVMLQLYPEGESDASAPRAVPGLEAFIERGKGRR